MRNLYISTVRGPWVSLGVHVDFQGPFVDLHLGWWIVSVGRLRHVQVPCAKKIADARPGR